MKNTIFIICILIAFAMIIIGCKGDTGPTGPAGPSANSVSFNLTNGDFSFWSTGVWISDKTVNAITSDVISNGAVLGYYQGTSFMTQLPWMSDNLFYRKYFHHDIGTVRFVSADYSSSPTLSGSGTWKLVIITGPQNLAKLSSIDVRNYEAVKSAFTLAE